MSPAAAALAGEAGGTVTCDPLALVAGLGAPHGIERSIKFMPGRVLDERYLVTFHRDALGAAPIERLTEMGCALAMPKAALDALPEAFEGADVVHLGREREGAEIILKIYFEYVAATRAAMNARTHAPTLVHRAFKWVPGPAGLLHVASYTWCPCRTYAEIEAHLDHPAVGEAVAPAIRCARAALSRLERRTGAGELFLMSVEEVGNPRRSLDINLYRAGLRVKAVADLLEKAALDLGSPAPETRVSLARCEDLALGHLSFGVARRGAPFLTLYFGVEAH